MPPKRSLSTTGGSSRSSRPSKRYRALGIGAPSADDAAASSPRLAQAQALAERAGGGASYLAVRPVRQGVKSLKETSLRVAAKGLYESVRMPPHQKQATPSHNVGWDPDRDPERSEEAQHLRTFIRTLPVEIANRLLRLVLDLTTGTSFDDPADPGVAVLSLAMLFFHPNTTRLSLSGMAAPTLLVSRIPQCTALAELDLSGHVALRDPILAKVVAQLPTLEVINLKGCTKIGDQTLVALSKASEDRLRVVNLSLTAVSIKGLTSLLARCKDLEVLKLANVQGLVRSLPARKAVDSLTPRLLCRTSAMSPSGLRTRQMPRAGGGMSRSASSERSRSARPNSPTPRSVDSSPSVRRLSNASTCRTRTSRPSTLSRRRCTPCRNGSLSNSSHPGSP